MKGFGSYNKAIRQLGIAFIAMGLTFTACSGQTKKGTNKITKKVTTMKTIHLTKADFIKKVANYEANPKEWKYLGDKPAIIDFFADWCGPCKALAPTMEQLAEEYGGKIYIYEVNVDEEQELASLFGVQSIPTLLYIPMNGKPQTSVGLVSKPAIKETIDNFLLK